MKHIIHEGKEGVFYTYEELQLLQNKVLAQKELIRELAAEVGVEV